MTKGNAHPDGEVLNRIAASYDPEGVIVVGVCGMAGAGKTTLCSTLALQHPGRVFGLNCDLFSAHSLSERRHRIETTRNSGNEKCLYDEENPQSWYDWDRIHEAIQDLRQHRRFSFEQAWNPRTGQLDAHYGIELPSTGQMFVLCDCIYLLHDPAYGWFDHMLILESSDQIIAARRKSRCKTTQAEQDARQRQDRFERPYFKRYAERAQTNLIL